MIRVNLMDKKTQGEEVQRIAIKTTELPKPKSYNDFITEIANYFLIRKKNSIILKCITNDDEEYEINSQEDLDDNIDEVKEFQVYSESGYEEPKKPIEKQSNNTESDAPKKDVPTGGDDDDEYKINLNVNLDIKDEEIEKIINSQIKEISIDEDLNDVIEFDSDKYKEELKKNTENCITKFKNEFDIKIKDFYAQKTTALITNFKNALDNYSKSQINVINKLSNDASGLYDGLGNMVKDTEDMNLFMEELKKTIGKNSPINMSEIQPNKVINSSNKVNKGPNRADQFAGGNMISNEDSDDEDNKNNNKLEVKFLKEVIKIDTLNTKCQYINVDDIKIENIGNKAFKKLYFIRDEVQSSENFIINQTTKINCHKLTSCGEEFKPGKKETHSITLKINNPESGKQYKLYLYVKEDEKGENISKPLEIICTVNEDEEEKIRREEAEERKKQERLRQEQEKQKEQERIKQEQEQEKERLRQEQEKQKEEERIKQEQEKERLRKEQEKQKNNNNSNNANANIDYQGLNQEEVNNLAQELDDEFNIFSIKNKEEVINKIIEYKCDREKMNDWIEESM